MDITEASQLGPMVQGQFVVRNAGPSLVPTVRLDILWPSRDSDTDENFVIYPSSISVDSEDVSNNLIFCTNNNIWCKQKVFTFSLKTCDLNQVLLTCGDCYIETWKSTTELIPNLIAASYEVTLTSLGLYLISRWMVVSHMAKESRIIVKDWPLPYIIIIHT